MSTLAQDAEAVRIIRDAVPGVIVVYRFGSTVDETTHAASDVDLAFFAPQPMDPGRRYELQERLALTLGRDVDLVDLRHASTVMQVQVVSRGVALAVFDAAEKERFEMYT